MIIADPLFDRDGVESMFDTNEFKRHVKRWIKEHPGASEEALSDYCEELIPAAQYVTHQWLVTQTLSWYRHTQKKREDKDEGDS